MSPNLELSPLTRIQNSEEFSFNAGRQDNLVATEAVLMEVILQILLLSDGHKYPVNLLQALNAFGPLLETRICAHPSIALTCL